MEEVTREFVQLIGESLEGRLKARVWPVVVTSPRGHWTIGTGQVLRIREHSFLLTAAHVLPHKDDGSKVFLVRPSPDSLVLEVPLSGRVSGLGGRYDGDPWDVAALHMDQSPEEIGIEPIELTDLAPSDIPTAGELVLVLGYPKDMLNRHTSGKPVGVKSLLWATTSLPMTKWGERHREVDHLMLEYRHGVAWNAGGGFVERKLPERSSGMSGAAIWTIRTQPQRLFSYKDLRMVGTVRAHNNKLDAMVCNRLGLLLTAIIEAYPDLQLPIERSTGCQAE